MQREEMRFRARVAVETFSWEDEARYCRNRRGKEKASIWKASEDSVVENPSYRLEN